MVLFTQMFYDPLFPQTEVSCVAGRDEGHTFSSPRWWSKHTQQTLRTVTVPQQACCLLRARTRRDIHKRHRTELLCCSGPAWQTVEARADPTLRVIQRFPTTVGDQPPKGHRLLPCLSSSPPSLTPLQGVLHTPWLLRKAICYRGPKQVAQNIPRLMAFMLLPLEPAYSHGAPAPPAPLLSGLSCPFLWPDQGTWENPMIQTSLTGPDPLCPAETILLTVLWWHVARSHKHLQSPENNRGSGLSRIVSPSNIALYLTTHTPLSDLNPSDSFHQADKMKGFFFLNISFNKTCMEYAHLCQWSGKCALSFFQRTCTLQISLKLS